VKTVGSSFLRVVIWYKLDLKVKNSWKTTKQIRENRIFMQNYFMRKSILFVVIKKQPMDT